MTEQSDLIPDLDSEDAFEVQMRGYSRRQVNEFVARSRSQTRDLEERLSRSLDEVERMRVEITSARQRESEGRPPYEEISERMGQILKLADDEARSQKTRALEDITKQRADAKQEIDRLKAEAREQTERMLAAAQEQAENAIATARAEADKTRNMARGEAERTVSDAHKKAEGTVTAAQAQAKQMLDEAAARAGAIHDGAERRLSVLVARHTETVRRLTEVRDVVTNLVAGEAARGSLEEEVARSVASTLAGGPSNGTVAPPRQPGLGEGGRHAPGATPVPHAPGSPIPHQPSPVPVPHPPRPVEAGNGLRPAEAGTGLPEPSGAHTGHRAVPAQPDRIDHEPARDPDMPRQAVKPARPSSARVTADPSGAPDPLRMQD